MIDKISTALDKNIFFICCIFLDLSKALDTVDYKILISKLHRYGFQDVVINWLSRNGESVCCHKLLYIKQN